jgi:DUF4097 and DUF4098 domain-containing protein YvlB
LWYELKKITCKYCGEHIEKDSRFCYFCGSSVIADKEQVQESATDGDIYSHTVSETEPIRKTGKRKIKGKKLTGIIIAAVVIGSLCIILPTTFLSIYGPLNFKYIGSTTYDSGVLVTNNATLTVYNFAGDVNVEYNPYISEVFMAEIFVYGRAEANLSEAESFSVNTDGNTTEFIFIDDSDYSYWDKTAMRYELYISLNPSVDFAFDIEAFSGDIELDLDYSPSSNITGVSLETFSGNIDADFGLSREITTPTFYVKTSSGNIDLVFGTNVKVYTTNFHIETFSGNIEAIFEDSNELVVGNQIDLITSSGSTIFAFDSGNLIADKLNLDGFSGNVYLELGFPANITLDEVALDISSGNIDIICLCTFYSNITWNIKGFSGYVDIYLDPIILPDINYTAEFNVDISSGDIDVFGNLDVVYVGVQATAATSSGDIDLPNGLSSYQSPDYASKTKKYIFDLETFSGNIDVVII